MMNNEDLKQQLKVLQEENLKLKTELEVFKLTQSTNMTIDQYYISKYLTNYNEIYSSRINEIDLEINNLTQEYQNLEDEINKRDEIQKLNKQYQEKLNELNRIKENNTLALVEIQTEYDKLTSELKEKQTILKNATLGYYNSILKAMENDLSLVSTTVEFVMEQLSDQLYLLILECRAVSYKHEILEKELELKKETMTKENEAIILQVNELQQKLERRTSEELGLLQDTIKDEITRRTKLKQELIDTFNLRKETDLKTIVDKINFYHITNTNNQKTCELLEELITSLCNSLKSQDTFKNLKAIKEMELIELLKKKKLFDVHIERFNELKSKEDEYYNAYMKASKLYDELVDFLESSILVISENINYYETTKKFNSLKEEEKQTVDLYNIVVANIDKLSKERDSLMLASFPSDEVKQLSVKLSELNNEKNRLSNLLREIRDEIRLLEKEPENIKLLTVLREKEFVEAKLSPLYNSLRALKVKINKIKEEIKTLEVTLKDYDALLNEIKELENEINN